MTEKLHEHCWHVTSSTTNGLGLEGWHKEICCDCGATCRRPWKVVLDSEHGSYFPVEGQRFGARILE